MAATSTTWNRKETEKLNEIFLAKEVLWDTTNQNYATKTTDNIHWIE